MAKYAIEARSFRVALAWSHHFWVLKNADRGSTLAELHGLAYDRLTQTILPIGTNRNHSLRVFVFPHDESYASMLGRSVQSTRMYWRSRAHVVYEGADGLTRWNAAVSVMPLLDRLDLTYPAYGFNLLTPTVNSNSAYRTFGEIMNVRVHEFGGALGPGLRSRMIELAEIELAKGATSPSEM
jgi:hypothetical protein